MKKNTKWVLILSVLAVLIITSTAFAGYGMIGPRQRLNTNNSNMMREYLLERGVTTEELQQWRSSGKTISEFLQDRNINESDLKKQILEDRKTILDEDVKSGLISERERDARIVLIEENLEKNWDRTDLGPARGGFLGMRNQMRNNFCGGMMGRGRR